MQALMHVLGGMSESHDTVKSDDSTFGKELCFCLSLIQKALGLAPDLELYRGGLISTGDTAVKYAVNDVPHRV